MIRTCAAAAGAGIGGQIITIPDLDVVLTAITDTGSPSALTSRIPPRTSLRCGITTVDDRSLTGSVVGSGDRPVPWS